MTDARDPLGHLLPDNQRITRLGRIVRQWSIDELPQLINVIRGDMSLIGPRPLLINYLPLYSQEQFRRHEVRPGISGWAQVNGRNSLPWSEKFRLDVEYVDRLSFSLDLQIAYLTVKKILVREGINQSATRPMEPFNGSN
jgi:lipopolysaccharide/colanic/teichoic acid biosynthesis glycosyltransferase